MIIGLGLQRKRDDVVLDVWFPVLIPDAQSLLSDISTIVSLSENYFIALTQTQLINIAALIPSHITMIEAIAHAVASPKSGYTTLTAGIMVMSDVTQAVQSVDEGYFKLQLISQRHVTPHGLSLDGVFAQLPNMAWTNYGPILPQDMPMVRVQAMADGRELQVSHVDKFPYLVNYHIPSGVRIASGSQVRLGAYLGEGTTIMPSGYVNFNAGTMGNAMVEGRVSAGVVVNHDSDIGGGASIMGTLSGGNQDVISVGSQCLLGANSGIGISLGDGCTVEAGLYITAGMKVLDETDSNHSVVKAKALSGRSNLLFIKDSQTGQIICKSNTKTIQLNDSLHENN